MKSTFTLLSERDLEEIPQTHGSNVSVYFKKSDLYEYVKNHTEEKDLLELKRKKEDAKEKNKRSSNKRKEL